MRRKLPNPRLEHKLERMALLDRTHVEEALIRIPLRRMEYSHTTQITRLVPLLLPFLKWRKRLSRPKAFPLSVLVDDPFLPLTHALMTETRRNIMACLALDRQLVRPIRKGSLLKEKYYLTP